MRYLTMTRQTARLPSTPVRKRITYRSVIGTTTWVCSFNLTSLFTVTYKSVNGTKPAILFIFLAVQNSSIGDLVTDSLTHSTFTFDLQRATQETRDLWDIWSEWWGDMTWLRMTYQEQSLRLATIETFDQCDEETWPDWKRPTKSENFPKIWKFSEILKIF